ncbi:hypothetical protein FKM82_024584 [Ascaphus truei]
MEPLYGSKETKHVHPTFTYSGVIEQLLYKQCKRRNCGYMYHCPSIYKIWAVMAWRWLKCKTHNSQVFIYIGFDADTSEKQIGKLTLLSIFIL